MIPFLLYLQIVFNRLNRITKVYLINLEKGG
jgi:hypothetical protein